MLKESWEQYKKPTPPRFRQVGDTILIFSGFLSTSIMGLPISEHDKLWFVFGSNLLGVIGKIMMNFFKDENGNEIKNN